MDYAINKGHGDEFLKKMFLEAMKLSCSDTFYNYGELLEDQSLYKQSINPINLILIEAIHKKRSPDDVVEFIKNLEQNPTVLRSLFKHAKEVDTEPSPADLADLARRIDFKTKNVRIRVVNALSGDNKEMFALHNATAGLGDSPKGPDRLGRRPLAQAVVKVLKTIEGPDTSLACSLFGGWGSGKTQFTNMLVDEIKVTPEEKVYPPMEPTLPFIWVCNLIGKCCCCFDHKHETSRIDIERTDIVNVSEDKFLCILYCCCSFVLLPFVVPISYIFKCFKYGKIFNYSNIFQR